ncbi:MAG: hypothetical protein DMD38_01440 [Gemmatimonadetes bacterium]|nr:MAG: hypothetical protein AUI86_01270 [Gemmatimonadetes bacterium 13_1_40CM_3_66_12]PYP98082.1 MAG: hypothetical protein DMD38_01440 [Gemmatimonadota bacterium]
MTASTASVAPAPAPPRLPVGAGVAIVIWLGLAVAAGASGFLLQLPFPGAQLIILGLVAVTIAIALVRGPVRTWLDALPLRVLVGFNAMRLIGVAFLLLAAQGSLNPVFASRAGWGDIAVAILAIVFVLAEPRRIVLHAWNVFGVLDLLVAVGTATVVTLQGTTPGVAPILTFPLNLVPTFFVPLLFANHVLIFRRLVGSGR